MRSRIHPKGKLDVGRRMARRAEARIVGRDKVEVWSTDVPRPVAARYAFNNNPRRPNLTNDTGLPAAPFRTDDRPDPTAGKR
jgi:sialate O-acetylesterase